MALGALPLSANAAELRSAAQAILDTATADLEKVLSAPGAKTVQNTLEPIDRILLRALDVQDHGSTLFSVHTSAEVRTAAREASEASHRFFSAFFVNRAAYDAL
ncbi:MAG: hypothetical protein L3K07_03660, partial [Thermoplasmata archaeon]|nr:hypothetical protein [Thermoplasmata archaeon]